MYLYDEAIEKKFYDLCQLDENPLICTEPVEASTYLDINLYTSAEGFQQMVEKAYLQYTTYVDQFIRLNSSNNRTYLLSTLTRLINKFHNISEQFNNSTIRPVWYRKSKIHSQNTVDELQIIKQQNDIHEIDRFFFNMSSIQLVYINKILDYLRLERSPYNNFFKSFRQSQKPLYQRFIINHEIAKTNKLLIYLYNELKTNNFIIGTKEEFMNLFVSSKEPIVPIVWKNEYIHLTYLIKQLRKNILQINNRPSDYKIARMAFFYKESGIFFDSAKERHDKDPKGIEKDKIDKIVVYAEKKFISNPTGR